MKKILLLICPLFVLTFCCKGQVIKDPGSWSSVINRVKSSVGQIQLVAETNVIDLKKGSLWQTVYGSTWAIDENTLCTAGHLYNNIEEAKLQGIDTNLLVILDGKTFIGRFEYANLSTRRDIAFIRVEEEIPYLDTSDRFSIGDEILVRGHPEGITIPHNKTGIIESSYDGDIALDIMEAPGISGAPAINARGEVIGMTTRIYIGEIYFTLAIPSERIDEEFENYLRVCDNDSCNNNVYLVKESE